MLADADSRPLQERRGGLKEGRKEGRKEGGDQSIRRREDWQNFDIATRSMVYKKHREIQYSSVSK